MHNITKSWLTVMGTNSEQIKSALPVDVVSKSQLGVSVTEMQSLASSTRISDFTSVPKSPSKPNQGTRVSFLDVSVPPPSVIAHTPPPYSFDPRSQSFSFSELKRAELVDRERIKSALSMSVFLGHRDKRTCPEFVHQFEVTFGNLVDDQIKASTFKGLINPSHCSWIKNRVYDFANYHELKSELMRVYWSQEVRATVYANFIQAKYKAKKNTTFVDFVDYWYGRVVDTQMVSKAYILKQLKMKTPISLATLLSESDFSSKESLLFALNQPAAIEILNSFKTNSLPNTCSKNHHKCVEKAKPAEEQKPSKAEKSNYTFHQRKKSHDPRKSTNPKKDSVNVINYESSHSCTCNSNGGNSSTSSESESDSQETICNTVQVNSRHPTEVLKLQEFQLVRDRFLYQLFSSCMRFRDTSFS